MGNRSVIDAGIGSVAKDTYLPIYMQLPGCFVSFFVGFSSNQGFWNTVPKHLLARKRRRCGGPRNGRSAKRAYCTVRTCRKPQKVGFYTTLEDMCHLYIKPLYIQLVLRRELRSRRYPYSPFTINYCNLHKVPSPLMYLIDSHLPSCQTQVRTF